jgi:hypothetical protein
METETDRITARDSLEYWDQQQQLAVARGDARPAVRGTDTIEADVLVAEFADGPERQPGLNGCVRWML